MEQNKNQTQVLQGEGLAALFNDATTTPNLEIEKEETKLPLDSLFNDEKVTPTAQAPAPITPKTEEVITSTSPDINVYTDKIAEWIEEGFWQDVDVEIENEAGEVELVSILDIKNMTPEMFNQLKEQQKAVKDEDFNSKYIGIEGLDDTTKKMIELKKAGGDISELIQAEVQFVHPLKGINLDDEQVQEYLVRQKFQALGWKPKHIDTEIEDLKENLILDVEAKKIIEEVNTNFDKAVVQKQQEHATKVELAKEEQKEFRKTVTETFRTLDLKNDSLVKTLVDNASKVDEYGLSNVDKAFFEAKKNPELFAKLTFMLTDEKGFNDFMGVKIKNTTNIDTMKKILKINPKATTQSAATPPKKSEGGLESFFQK